MQLQPGLSLADVDFVLKPQVVGNELIWDLTNDPATGQPLTVGPNGITDRVIIDFSVRIDAQNANGNPYVTRATAEYNDPAYPYPGPKNSVMSAQSFYPQGRVVVYPNPFSRTKNKLIKFDNVVPGSIIQVYTVSGEGVVSLQAQEMKVYWDMKNSGGRPAGRPSPRPAGLPDRPVGPVLNDNPQFVQSVAHLVSERPLLQRAQLGSYINQEVDERLRG